MTKTFPEEKRVIRTEADGRRKSMDFLDDNEIIKRYFERDEEAVRETERKYGAYLKKLARDLTDDRRDAEECVNDVYLGAWNSIPPNRPDSLKAYLTALIRRSAADVFRKNGRERRIPKKLCSALDDLADILPGGDADTELDSRCLSRIISGFVSQLPDRSKYIFISRYYANRKTGEVAKKLGVSRSTVAKELAKMKDELKARLEKEGYNV